MVSLAVSIYLTNTSAIMLQHEMLVRNVERKEVMYIMMLNW